MRRCAEARPLKASFQVCDLLRRAEQHSASAGVIVAPIGLELVLFEMRSRSLLRDARNCRCMAIAYKGRPEFQFLLSIADAFENLAATRNEQMRPLRELRTRPKGGAVTESFRTLP